MQRKKIGTLVLAVLVIFAAFFGWKEYTRKVEPVTDIKPAYEVSAIQLIKEFEANDSISTKKYSGKLIAVNGPISKVDKDAKGFITIVLGGPVSMSSVRCAMDSSFANELISLRKEQTINIKGMFTGFQKDETGLLGSDIILNRCVVEKPQTTKQD